MLIENYLMNSSDLSTISHEVKIKYAPIIQENRRVYDCIERIDAKYLQLQLALSLAKNIFIV